MMIYFFILEMNYLFKKILLIQKTIFFKHHIFKSSVTAHRITVNQLIMVTS